MYIIILYHIYIYVYIYIHTVIIHHIIPDHLICLKHVGLICTIKILNVRYVYIYIIMYNIYKIILCCILHIIYHVSLFHHTLPYGCVASFPKLGGITKWQFEWRNDATIGCWSVSARKLGAISAKNGAITTKNMILTIEIADFSATNVSTSGCRALEHRSWHQWDWSCSLTA